MCGTHSHSRTHRLGSVKFRHQRLNATTTTISSSSSTTSKNKILVVLNYLYLNDEADEEHVLAAAAAVAESSPSSTGTARRRHIVVFGLWSPARPSILQGETKQQEASEQKQKHHLHGPGTFSSQRRLTISSSTLCPGSGFS